MLRDCSGLTLLMVCASVRKAKGAVIDLQELLGPQMGPDLGSGGFGRVTLHMFNSRPWPLSRCVPASLPC